MNGILAGLGIMAAPVTMALVVAGVAYGLLGLVWLVVKATGRTKGYEPKAEAFEPLVWMGPKLRAVQPRRVKQATF